MINRIKITGLFLLMGILLMGSGLPKQLQKRVEKEIEKVFEVESIEIKSYPVSSEINASLPTKITADNFFKLEKGSKLIGYFYVGNAPSKTAIFDYLVVFDANVKVVHSKVLVYREEYGGEIGSKRWLKQFVGKSGKDRVDHTTNIDGISGATISVRSMTNAIDSLLQTIGILQNKKLL